MCDLFTSRYLPHDIPEGVACRVVALLKVEGTRAAHTSERGGVSSNNTHTHKTSYAPTYPSVVPAAKLCIVERGKDTSRGYCYNGVDKTQHTQPWQYL